MHLELNDEQTEVLIRELAQLIDNDRYFLGPRVRVLKAPVLRKARKLTTPLAHGLALLPPYRPSLILGVEQAARRFFCTRSKTRLP